MSISVSVFMFSVYVQILNQGALDQIKTTTWVYRKGKQVLKKKKDVYGTDTDSVII